MMWPEGTRESQKAHALNHVLSLDFAIGLCKQRRTAVQAGGNVGLWPLRMARDFEQVITFEPDRISFECLKENVSAKWTNVLPLPFALGGASGRCSIVRASLGSHSVTKGRDVIMFALDDIVIDDLDLLQLDIEGYELCALIGAKQTIQRCGPVIQVELRGFTERYGGSDAEVVKFLTDLGYREAGRQPGNDVIFTRA